MDVNVICKITTIQRVEKKGINMVAMFLKLKYGYCNF
jgi:hypothetical protein